MKDEKELRLLYPLPPINLSALVVKLMQAIEALKEHEAKYGPISKRGKKKNDPNKLRAPK